MTTPSNPRAISTAREERIREENAARTLDGASVGPEADVRDLLLQLDHERAELSRVTRGRDLATTRRNDLARELDAVRASVVERITEHSRGVVAGIAGAMGLDASGEGDAVHARIIAEHERLTRALAEARAALREYAPRCGVCDVPATREDPRFLLPMDRYGCDAHGNQLGQMERADALRAATVTL